MPVFNKTKGNLIAQRVVVAKDLFSRMRGLLGRKSLDDEALWIVPCMSIHTIGMRFAIDVLFLDASMKVVKAIKDIKPFRVSPIMLKAKSVLELPKDTILSTKTEDGDVIEIVLNY